MARRDGYIGFNRIPTTGVSGTASGIWSLEEVEHRRREGAWPITLPPLPYSTGLSLWFDAADNVSLYDATSGGSLVGANGSVARWQDKSGNGIHCTQSTSGYRAVRKIAQQNGFDALLFDGVDDRFFLSPSFSAGNWTFFFACKPATSSRGAGGRYIFDTQTGRILLAQHDAVTVPYSSVSSYVTAWNEHAVSTTANQVLCWRLNSTGTAGQVYRNGTQIGSDFSYSQRAIGGNTAIGGDYSGGDAMIDGYLYEVLVYNTALSDTNMGIVNSYLQTKWGIP